MTKKGGRKKKATPGSGPDAPENLEENARRYFQNAESFRKKREQRSMDKAYKKALELGKASGTPDGLAIAAEASLYLGHRAKTTYTWGEALERYKEAVELGRRSGTPEGFYAGARAAWNLGNTYEEAGMDGLELAFRDAIDLGRDSEMPDGLDVAAKAASNLAGNLDGAREVWREAIELGKASGTREGGTVANKGMYYLAVLLLGEEDVEGAIQVFSEMDRYKGGPIIWDHWTDLRWEILAIHDEKKRKALLKSLRKIRKAAVQAIESELEKYTMIFNGDSPQQVTKLLHYVSLYDIPIAQRIADGQKEQVFRILSETKEPSHIAQLLAAYLHADKESARAITKDFQNHWVDLLRIEDNEFPGLLSKLVDEKLGLGEFITRADSVELSAFLRRVLRSDRDNPTTITTEIKGHWSEIIKVNPHRCMAILSIVVHAVSDDEVRGIETEIGRSGGALSVIEELDDALLSKLEFYRTSSESSFKGAQTGLVNSRFTPEEREVLWSQLLSLSWDIYPIARKRALIALLNLSHLSEMKKKAKSRILELTDDPDPFVREQTIGTLKHYLRAIPKNQYNSVLKKILKLADDPHVLVRRAAIWNLSDFKDIIGKKQFSAVLKCLNELARDVDSEVRSSVPGCIGKSIKGLGLKDILPDEHLGAAITILLELAEDLDEGVRGRASTNLRVFKEMLPSERFDAIVEEFNASR